jgi:filamentous hemagglutinin
MDVAAKGGWLYAQAMEEFSHYERQTTKRKWWGKKPPSNKRNIPPPTG